jgi:hypothetical protein
MKVVQHVIMKADQRVPKIAQWVMRVLHVLIMKVVQHAMVMLVRNAHVQMIITSVLFEMSVMCKVVVIRLKPLHARNLKLFLSVVRFRFNGLHDALNKRQLWLPFFISAILSVSQR